MCHVNNFLKVSQCGESLHGSVPAHNILGGTVTGDLRGNRASSRVRAWAELTLSPPVRRLVQADSNRLP
ncbi:hypothetical protein SKAU_G00114390 [Synaphobranchus kaupii]|uniref:Uncharacterized protein n=1 Tax=Synaphobranchus kaupii TaxID=118154 RepID=A0A9Q1G137_SYNKA|nr:hypothetical protein SKAU_G00114390 [Synaphobranchus kaupii]